MASEAQLARVYGWALVVDEQELRRLADEAQRAVAPEGQEPSSISLDLHVQLSDKLSLKLDSLDDLLKEENPKRRAITGVELRAATRNSEVLCRIGLEKEGASSLSVRGQNRQWVYVTFSRIEERLRRMKQLELRKAAWSLVPVRLFHEDDSVSLQELAAPRRHSSSSTLVHEYLPGCEGRQS